MDPRLNCAADICCPPKQARETRIELLCEAGCSYSLAETLVDNLCKMGITFAPIQLMKAISEMVNHPNRLEVDENDID